MSGMFLEVAIDNAHFMLPRGIHTLAKGPVGRIDDVHQICTYYRQLGVATLLQEGSADRYHICAMQSAGMYLYELEPQPDGAKVTSFAKPLFDAIGSGYWEAARWIAEASRPTWNPEREYEDDFLYVWFLIQHGVLQAPAEVTEPILERYEEVLDGELDLRLDVCRALLRRHAKDFDTALVGLLERRRHDVNAMADRGALGDDAAMWMRHFSLEGVALLKIAERLRMATEPQYLHCPGPVRGESPWEFDRGAWGRVHYRGRRRGRSS